MDLPSEIVMKIFKMGKYSIKDIANFGLVCKQWRAVVESMRSFFCIQKPWLLMYNSQMMLAFNPLNGEWIYLGEEDEGEIFRWVIDNTGAGLIFLDYQKSSWFARNYIMGRDNHSSPSQPSCSGTPFVEELLKIEKPKMFMPDWGISCCKEDTGQIDRILFTRRKLEEPFHVEEDPVAEILDLSDGLDSEWQMLPPWPIPAYRPCGGTFFNKDIVFVGQSGVCCCFDFVRRKWTCVFGTLDKLVQPFDSRNRINVIGGQQNGLLLAGIVVESVTYSFRIWKVLDDFGEFSKSPDGPSKIQDAKSVEIGRLPRKMWGCMNVNCLCFTRVIWRGMGDCIYVYKPRCGDHGPDMFMGEVVTFSARDYHIYYVKWSKLPSLPSSFANLLNLDTFGNGIRASLLPSCSKQVDYQFMV